MRSGIVAVACLTLACAVMRGRGEFEENVGLATAAEAAEMVNKVLTLHQFELETEEGPPNIYYQTYWRDRRPFPDEEEAGIVAAQVRTIVRARPRSATSALGTTYSVNIRVEQRVRLISGLEWVHNVISDGARAYAGRIIADLRRELDIGVRRHGNG